MNKDDDIFIPANYAFQDKAPVFLFSNENVAEYVRSLGNMKNANVLTVAASGDHMFEAYLAGAKNVDTFDINSFQRCVVELKNHMIKYVERDDFLRFFFSSKDFFDHKIIEPIYDKFSVNLQYFFSKYETKGREMFRYRAACHPEYSPFTNLTYLQKDNYYKLRDLLPDTINFKHCDISNISKRFSQKYDVIMLSNIFDYMFTEHRLQDQRFYRLYSEILKVLAQNNLNKDNGCIGFHYLWEGNAPAWSNFLDFFQRTQIKNEPHTFAARGLNSAYGYDRKDVALFMRQNHR